MSACAIHPDGSRIAVVDASNDHVVSVYDVDSQTKVMEGKSGPDKVFDLAFSQRDGDYTLWSAGIKHMACWQPDGRMKKCIFGNAPRTSMACVTADNQGRAFSGGANALIYVWGGNTLIDTKGFHGKGFVGAISFVNGKLFSGGKDGRVCIINPETLECEKAIEFGALPRALDFKDGCLVVGLSTGSIVLLDENENMITLMQSHNSGEVWGLDDDGAFIYSSGDDNQVKVWDPATRTCVTTGSINAEERWSKQGVRASTLGKFPCSQSGRAVAVSPNGHVAVCANDGSVTIRSKD